MSENVYDAVVIGGGIEGLVAAALLARGGARTVLCEARETFGGEAENVPLAAGFNAPLGDYAIAALDRSAITALHLDMHGVRFSTRDVPLVALRPGGAHFLIPREIFAARTALGRTHRADADAYVRFRRFLFRLARRLRPFWLAEDAQTALHHGSGLEAMARVCRLSDEDAHTLERLSRMSAASLLDEWFEADALKSALGFDATTGGLSPYESGSALVLVWRAAQEMSGLQGAVSRVAGGPGALVTALENAARKLGAELRPNARVREIGQSGGKVWGVVLENGEHIAARAVVSSLGARETLLQMLTPSAIGFDAPLRMSPRAVLGAGRLLIGLEGAPPIAGLGARGLRGRLIIAERPESAAEAKGRALTGDLPDELVLEANAVLPEEAGFVDTQRMAEGHVLAVRIPFLPLAPQEGWHVFVKRVLNALESYAPGLKDRIVATAWYAPEELSARYGGGEEAAFTPDAMLMSALARVQSSVRGLFLCGRDAEPVPLASGRAGRIAAAFVLSQRDAAP
jgi:phytoene dehydrogenase-like protein